MRGVFDEIHVLGEMLFGVDLAFLAQLQLGQTELSDYWAILPIEILPNLDATRLFGRRIRIARWINSHRGASSECQEHHRHDLQFYGSERGHRSTALSLEKQRHIDKAVVIKMSKSLELLNEEG